MAGNAIVRKSRGRKKITKRGRGIDGGAHQMTIRIEIMMARGSVEKMTLLKKDIIETSQINISAPSIAMMTIKVVLIPVARKRGRGGKSIAISGNEFHPSYNA